MIPPISPIPRPRRSAVRAVTAAALVVVLAACGETVDLADPANPVTSESAADVALERPISADAEVDELFEEMLLAWIGLSERVVQGDRAGDARDRIVALWRQAEPTVRRQRPEMLFGFEQAVDLASSSVDRRRPADASKGYQIAANLVADFRQSA